MSKQLVYLILQKNNRGRFHPESPRSNVPIVKLNDELHLSILQLQLPIMHFQSNSTRVQF